MNMRRAAVVSSAAVLGILLTGCGGSTARSGSDQPGVALPPGAAPGPAGAAARVSISDTSEQDMAATLRANGVDDAAEWADLIVQSRPYPPGDARLGKLRQVLTEHQAPPDTVDKITNALEPS
ncbi:hypothetical protein [Pseudonocardia spinosispora]|uniref:hypothetical protein n=1 Tax=Pseudonocardia spinosispora TaxID=103441 RepID=UPI0004199DD6|nr:hypothetical protein [Pseudonocardia spinosispora]